MDEPNSGIPAPASPGPPRLGPDGTPLLVPLRPVESAAERWLAQPEATLCFCFGTTTGQIVANILETRSPRVESVVEALGAGGGCGSCRLEIADLIHALLGVEPDMSVDPPARPPS